MLLRVTRRASASALRPSGHTRPAPLTMASRPRLLVVDDNSLNQLLLSEMLQVLGYEADIEADGRAAVSHCAATPPDGVLMDLQMPVMDGIEATRRIRELQAERRIPHFPIVAATALTSLQDREACMRAGMDGYLTKPLDLRSLAVELGRHVPAQREQPPGGTSSP
ncbi:MAG TPA: response regulator, partial [Ramlibacter sp.]|nr:response regulator [Ramlibacter sp.]